MIDRRRNAAALADQQSAECRSWRLCVWQRGVGGKESQASSLAACLSNLAWTAMSTGSLISFWVSRSKRKPGSWASSVRFAFISMIAT